MRNDRQHMISMIGDMHVGKTAISNAFLRHKFVSDYQPTIGATMVKFTHNQGDRNIQFCIIDTAGMEQYKSMAPVFYKQSEAAILVYDVTKKDSFDDLQEWYDRYREHKLTEPLIIVGNKIDLDEREITFSQGERWTEDHNCYAFVETSAKEGINLDTLLAKMTEIVEAREKSIIESAKLETAEKETCCL